MYKCPKCKIDKPKTEFHNSSTIKRGFAYYCKQCANDKNKIKRQKRREFGPTIFRESKVCFKCKNLLPISQFPKNRNTADGYVSYCKPCWVVITRKAQLKN